MTTVVGVDPSLTRAGIATISSTAPIRLSSVGAAGLATDNYDDRRERIELQAYEIGKRIGHPDLILLEGPIYHGKIMPSYFDRAGLFWGLMSTLSRRAPIAVVSPTTRSKYATGKAVRGTEGKKLVHAATRTMFPAVNVANHDQADGLICAALGWQKLGFDLPFTILDRHLLALDAVAWPVNLPTGVTS